MAERERIPNKQRREQARAERKRREAEQAEQQRRNSWRNGVIAVVVVAAVGAIVLQAVTGGTESIEDAVLISASEAEDARASAGCEYLTEESPLEDRTHVDNVNEVNPSTAYTDTRPTHSGPHTVGVHPVTPSASSQIDEVSSTHNLEHGSIIVWWDPEQTESSTASELGAWAEELNASGFRRTDAGVGVLTSPYEDPGISSDSAVAFRAWGTAMDCDEWNETVAYSFVLEHFGTEGIGPERRAAPFPTEVLQYTDEGETGGDTGDDDATDDATDDDTGDDAEDQDEEG